MTGLQPVPFAFPCGGYREVKDPCPVYDGSVWHLFGTGVRADGFDVLHATARHLHGRWRLHPPVDIRPMLGSCVAAPGTIADGDGLHMFLQTDYNVLGGCIGHLISRDGGATFQHSGTVLCSLPGTEEAGLYDAHPALIAGERYLVYSAFSVVGTPDIHLARSAGDWSGPWERLGAILRHEDVPCHNQRGSQGYEWGLEGAQLAELPDGRVLLDAVCFLPDAPHGMRQRVFLAVANTPTGAFRVLGPAVAPPPGGENGHGAIVTFRERLWLLHQERDGFDAPWRYGLATAPLGDFLRALDGSAHPLDTGEISRASAGRLVGVS